MKIRRLEGKYALITGSSTGIGQAIAMRFSREGANVALNYIARSEELEIISKLVDDARQAAGYQGRGAARRSGLYFAKRSVAQLFAAE